LLTFVTTPPSISIVIWILLVAGRSDAERDDRIRAQTAREGRRDSEEKTAAYGVFSGTEPAHVLPIERRVAIHDNALALWLTRWLALHNAEHMNTNTDSALRNLIENFTRDIQAAVRASLVDDLRSVLGGVPAKRGPGRPRGPKPGKRGPGRPAKAAKGGRRGRPAQVDAGLNDRVLGAIRAQPGRSVSALADGLGMKSDAIKRPITQLLASGSIRKTGQKRGTLYFAGKGSTAVAASAGGARKKAGRKAKAKAKRTPEQQAAIDARMAKMRAARKAG